MKLVKRFIKLMKIGKILGLGRSSEVYEYGTDKVLKLYLKEHSYETVKWEYDKLVDAKSHNAPVPAVYELIEHNGRLGIIMERINGESLLGIIINHIIETGGENDTKDGISESMSEIAKGMAKLLYSIHNVKANLMDSSKDILIRAVHYNKQITDDEKRMVLEILDSLPKGDTVCHGDPNPGNILVNGQKVAFIDWMFVGTGHPMYDIAEYVMTTRYFTLEPENKKVIKFMYKYCEEIINIFLGEYSGISDLEITDIDKWLIPLLVNRLNGGGSEEYKQRLLTDIRKKLNLYC